MVRQKLTIGHFQSGYPESDGMTAAVHGMSEALVEAGHRVVIYGYGRSHTGTGMKIPSGSGGRHLRRSPEPVLQSRRSTRSFAKERGRPGSSGDSWDV